MGRSLRGGSLGRFPNLRGGRRLPLAAGLPPLLLLSLLLSLPAAGQEQQQQQLQLLPWHLVDLPALKCDRGLDLTSWTVNISLAEVPVQERRYHWCVTLFRNFGEAHDVSLSVVDANGREVLPKEDFQLLDLSKRL